MGSQKIRPEARRVKPFSMRFHPPPCKQYLCVAKFSFLPLSIHCAKAGGSLFGRNLHSAHGEGGKRGEGGFWRDGKSSSPPPSHLAITAAYKYVRRGENVGEEGRKK